MRMLGDAAARGTGLTLAGQAVRLLLQTASVVVLARLLLPEDFGIVAMVVAITGVADIIRDFGLSSAAIQARSLSDGERTNLFWANVAIGVLCAAVTALAAPAIAALYGEPRLGPIVLAVAGVFVVTAATTQFKAELSRTLAFRAIVLADVLAQATGIAVAIALALGGAGHWSIVAQQVVVPVTVLVVAVLACPWRPGRPRREVPIGRFFRFGGNLAATQLLAYVTKNIDNVLIGVVWGSAQLGIYSRAYQLLMTPLNQINAPLTGVALPVLSRVAHDDEVYERYLRRAQIVGCYVTATVFAVCAGLAQPLVDVLFGPNWSGIAPVFAVLAVGGVFRAVAQLSYWIYLSRGLTGAQLRLFLVVRPLMIGLILAGLPWGITGVAVGCTAGALLQWLVPMWHVGRVAGVDSRGLVLNAVRSIAVISVPTALAAHLAALAVDEPFLRLALGLLAVALTLAVTVRLIAPVREDVRTIVSFARRAVRGAGT